MIEERRRLGLDRRDDMRSGVLHVMFPVSSARVEGRAALAVEILSPLGEAHEKLPFYGWISLASLGVALRLVDGRHQMRTPLGIEEV